MDIGITTNGDTTRYELVGSMDEHGAEKLKASFERLDLRQARTIVLDFSKVTFIGSAGLGKLLLFYKKTSTAGAVVRIENCTRTIYALLKEVRMDTLFAIS
jgi:anti-sigma B factor antagonist